MNSLHRLLALCALLLFCAGHAHGQAEATAVRRHTLSLFGMGSGVFTDVAGFQVNSYRNGGHNLAITAGGDLGVASFGRYALSAEVRGSYPFKSGRIVGERSILGGARISREPLGNLGLGGRFRPYADVLFGRGDMRYQSGGYVSNGLVYIQTGSWLYGAGGGAEYDVIGPLSAKAEVQFQHWSTPVTNSGSALPLQVGVGVTYRFGAGAGPR